MKNSIKLALSLSLILFTTFLTTSCYGLNQTSSGWENVSTILKQIIPPTFPDKNFDIREFGAIGDGITDCTDAFKLAIDTCSKSGGGKVIVPEGIFLTGAIHLKSNVDLYLSENSTIKFSTDAKKYLPVVFSRWEGVECMNYSALIYAYEQENIAITGKGILDGQAGINNWWNWKGNKDFGWEDGMPSQKKGREILFKMSEENVPPEQRIMGEGYFLRPNFVQFYKSKNILIQGVIFKNSPMWFIHPVLCKNVSIIGVKVEGLGPNNDGCDPESSKDVLIKNCYFNNGDDCIAIKSGRNNDGRRLNIPSENIIIQNCKMEEGHGGVVIGSEVSGGVRNVFAENCTMSSPNLDRAFRIKTNSIRGGDIQNVFIKDITIGEVKQAILTINFYYEEGDIGQFMPSVNNIQLENITSQKSEYALWIKAYERSKIHNLYLKNCKFFNVKNDDILENVENIKMENVSINNKEITQ